MKFHFTQAVCGIREQYTLERVQGMGGESQKLTCASTALDSKSESGSAVGHVRGRDREQLWEITPSSWLGPWLEALAMIM